MECLREAGEATRKGEESIRGYRSISVSGDRLVTPVVYPVRIEPVTHHNSFGRAGTLPLAARRDRRRNARMRTIVMELASDLGMRS